MSSYTLKNELLTVTIDTAGAEITSILDTEGTEYIWNADPAYWKRHSPVLFPFVGSLKNKEFHHNGVSYPMGQHGFARDMEFEPVSCTDTEASFVLRADETTLAKYPFRFELMIAYRLTGNCVSVIWKVTNHDNETMPFSIGAHPAFYCPIPAGSADARTGYEFRFDNEKPLTFHAIAEGGLADTHTDHPLPETADHVLTITDHLFDGDALIIDGHQAQRVELARKGEDPYITVVFDAPLFGLWAPPGADTPFVCIEPWFGRCDATDFDGTLAEREHSQFAEVGEEKVFQYDIYVK